MGLLLLSRRSPPCLGLMDLGHRLLTAAAPKKPDVKDKCHISQELLSSWRDEKVWWLVLLLGMYLEM